MSLNQLHALAVLSPKAWAKAILDAVRDSDADFPETLITAALIISGDIHQDRLP